MCQLHKMIFHKVRIMNIIGECNQVCFVAAAMDDAFLMAEPRLPPKSAADLKHQILNRPKQQETSIQSSCNAKSECRVISSYACGLSFLV